MIFDKARDNAEAIASIGRVALEKSALIGAPIHYMHAAFGDGLIRHFPDGTRHRLLRINGELTIVETLEPGAAVVPR